MTRIIDRLADVSSDYDVLLCDLWGCLHDGVTPFPEAVAALRAFRDGGGTVALLTNAPRPRAHVAAHLSDMGVPDDAWDTIVTSGDAARAALFRGAVGRRIWHIGEGRDLTFFEPLNILADPVEITRVPRDEAEGIVCTGPFDPRAHPDTLRADLLAAKTNDLVLLCANPDIVVDRGGHREWCAGAIAQLYDEMGGRTLSFGKPHPPVYDLARQRLAEVGSDPDEARILAVGDGILTDIAGAAGEEIDSLFVTGGLAAAETRTERQPDAAALRAFLDAEARAPTYAIGYLR